MAKLIYAAIASLDGYVEDEEGSPVAVAQTISASVLEWAPER